MTEKLYYKDSFIKSFEAEVVSCREENGRYAVVISKTAFFPEGGGQFADAGMLGECNVLDVQIVDGEIIHYLDKPLEIGQIVKGELDWETRFRRMQNHTGEHIVCGIAHRMYGYDNVGFHLGTHDVTLDLNGELTREQIREIEILANKVVGENVPVTVDFPSADELDKIEYRSKLELTEDVRIVTIQGYDRCACCAPHVKNTGEIGMIKLLDFMRHKGGVRIHMQCGLDAVDDFNVKYDNIAKISELLSVPQEKTADAVVRVLGEIQNLKQTIYELNQQLVALKLEEIKSTEGNMCFFEPTFGADELRALVNGAVPLCGGVCAAFSGDDSSGYSYIMGSANVPLRSVSKLINTNLSGKGGGTDQMIQGRVSASRKEIVEFFEKEKFGNK